MRILDWRRTRQQVVQPKFAVRVKARFNPFRRDSAGCTIAMRWRHRLKSNSSEEQTLFLETRRTRHGSRFLRAPFLDPQSAYDLKPKSLCKPERSPFHVGQNDLAIHRCAFLFSPPILNWRSFTRCVTNPAWHMRLLRNQGRAVLLRDACHRCTTQESLLRDPPLFFHRPASAGAHFG